MPFRPLKSFFPSADELLQQDLPALGAVLLTHLKSYEGLNTVYQHAGLNRGYFRAMLENRSVGLGPLPKEQEYGARQPEVTTRMMEAWNWLERQGLLIRNDEQVADWFIISSDGEKLLKSADLTVQQNATAEHSRPSDASDERRFMELAIEEAKKSVAEDERPHPRVGAVIVKDGRVLARAHRGENPKSHAEYVALEEKLPSETLAGATVYTTLEPCTKRNPPKICCAQRIVDRRVARVFIGMLDPNPDIRGLGEQLLSDAGIDTQLFPRDLKAQVEEMNRVFIRDQKEKSRSRTAPARSMSRDEFKNPQIKSEFLGEYPDGPILWITADREVLVTQLDYLDLHEAKVDSDKTELSGQDFRLPIDHAKLVRINNLMHSGGHPFRMKFRVEVTAGGRSVSHVIPAIIEPAMKPIQGTLTGFMRIVGSTTGYAL
jgi:pyrimidine deaminase RibD-like protein